MDGKSHEHHRTFDHVITLRKERSLTQQEMADKVGLHVNQIRRHEAGNAQPSLEALKKIARAVIEGLILKHDASRFSAAG